MSDWTVEIETSDGVASDGDVLERFAHALEASLGMTGAAASVNMETGLLSATFTGCCPERCVRRGRRRGGISKGSRSKRASPGGSCSRDRRAGRSRHDHPGLSLPAWSHRT